MKRWTPVAADPAWDGVILFDGVCVFCSRWVAFVAARSEAFRFLPIQSDAGRRLAAHFGIDPEAPQTNVVIAGGRAWFKADAAIVVLERLPRFSAAALLKVFPRFVRDAVYDLFATNRYAWFGRSEACMTPSPGLRARVIDHL